MSRVEHLADEELDELAPGKRKKPQSDNLLQLANGVELFHQDVDEPFASITIGDHIETWPVHSKAFKRWLCREYYVEYQKVPSSQALQDALNVLAGRAIHDGRQI